MTIGEYSTETVHLLNIYEDVFQNVKYVSNLTINLADKNKTISQLNEAIDLAQDYKEQLQTSRSSIQANRVLALESAYLYWREEIEMWRNLQKDNYDAAWENLVSAEYAALNAVRAHPISDHLYMELALDRIHAIEKIVFPRQLFFSPGFTVGTAICSICDQEYSECQHIKHLPYNGEFCYTEITDIVEMDHVAIVDDPANKLARAMKVGNKDPMTGLPVEDPAGLSPIEESES